LAAEAAALKQALTGMAAAMSGFKEMEAFKPWVEFMERAAGQQREWLLELNRVLEQTGARKEVK
jgi:hypothetical protein